MFFGGTGPGAFRLLHNSDFLSNINLAQPAFSVDLHLQIGLYRPSRPHFAFSSSIILKDFVIS